MTSFTNLPNGIPDILLNTSWADEVEEAEARSLSRESLVDEVKPKRVSSSPRPSPARGQWRSELNSPRDSPRNSPKISPRLPRGPSPKLMEGSGLTTSRWARPEDFTEKIVNRKHSPVSSEVSQIDSPAKPVSKETSQSTSPAKPLPKETNTKVSIKPSSSLGYLSTRQLEWVDCPADLSFKDILTYFNSFTGEERLSATLSDKDTLILTFKTPECGKLTYFLL
ncbi:hypothetical protein DSO57_1008338 [Entomophthora muscae]|uniref:Uncharacterized protein n=1 Tax=Entomophthora muscae TaxID=34485 RepID=A0ACC2S946_9FUNG|nr:hypothetical protein DSO57_1008338 [Entomophthora muscae]